MDHIPTEIIPLPCPVNNTSTRVPPPVVASLDVGNPLTIKPLPSKHTAFIAKAVTDNLPVQHGVKYGMMVGAGNTPASPHPPSQPPYQKLLI